MDKSVTFELLRGEDFTMFFSMGVLQIVIEVLAILLSLLLLIFITAFFYFCCYKLQNIGESKEEQLLSLVEEQGRNSKKNKLTVFVVENERKSKQQKDLENIKILNKKSDELSKLIENHKILQKKRDRLQRLIKGGSTNVNADFEPKKYQFPLIHSFEDESEKQEEVSRNSYLNIAAKERDLLFDPRYSIPLRKYKDLIDKCKV